MDIDTIANFSNDCSIPTGYDINTLKNLSVYPNPTTEYINVSFNAFYTDFQIEVFDLIGNKLHITNQSIINLKDYVRGVYILKITCNDSVKEVKVIKE